MKVNSIFLLSGNPFFDAYVNSDLLGKLIFLALVAISICSWVIIIHKIILTYRVRKYSSQFNAFFQQQKGTPLSFEFDPGIRKNKPNPFLDLYLVLKKYTLEILNKNRRFGHSSAKQNVCEVSAPSYLSPSDIEFVDAHLLSTIATQIKDLEKNLFILSTIYSLGPFLGLLGTVWGILITFSELQSHPGGGPQMVLGGLSLALATTVLGLLDAIPALIGYNYLKNNIGSFQTELEGFSIEILAAVEMQYRKVDIQ